MSVNERMDKKDVIHTHTNTLRYYSALKKKKILPFSITWLELEAIMLSERTQRKTKTI